MSDTSPRLGRVRKFLKSLAPETDEERLNRKRELEGMDLDFPRRAADTTEERYIIPPAGQPGRTITERGPEGDDGLLMDPPASDADLAKSSKKTKRKPG